MWWSVSALLSIWLIIRGSKSRTSEKLLKSQSRHGSRQNFRLGGPLSKKRSIYRLLNTKSGRLGLSAAMDILMVVVHRYSILSLKWRTSFIYHFTVIILSTLFLLKLEVNFVIYVADRKAIYLACSNDQCLLSGTFTEVKSRRPRLVLGWVTTRENRGAVNLGPFVGVDLNLSPTVYIAVVVLTRT